MKPKLQKICLTIIAGTMKWQVKRLLRRHPDVKIVAITGSVGKTMTKLAIAPVLAKKYKVLVHPGNYNSETGVPLSIFELESPGGVLKLGAWARTIWQIEKKVRQPFAYEVIVQEIGASHVGDIGYFSYLKPDIGVVTATKPAHLEGFGSIENIVEEKFKLARFSRLALINADEARLQPKLAELPPEKVKTYGFGRGDYSFEQQSFSDVDGFVGTMKLVDDTSFEVKLHLPAKHNVGSAVAAAAVGQMMGVPNADIKAALEALRPINGRMDPLPGKNGSLIIDDTYNGSPEAIIAALDTLYSMSGRKIAILGGMNEMGAESARYHKEVGAYCGRLDLLVTVAEYAKQYVAPAQQAGLKPEQIASFDSPYEAGDYVAKLLKKGDKVLVKGSQGGIFSEEATARLLKDPADTKKLVRQSPFWQIVKHKAFEKKSPTHED